MPRTRGLRVLATVQAALAAALLAGAALAADRVAIDELLRNARLWQSLDRPDNVRLVLTKILAMDAGEPQALLLLGELELRAGQPGASQRLLERLQQRSAAEAGELQQLQRLYTRDAARLNQLRLLRRGGNTPAALALAGQLFPDGRPPGALAAEFAPLLAQAPGGWERVRAHLEQRIARGGSPRERLALYELLGERPATRAQALRGLDTLAAQAELPAARIEAARRTVLAARAAATPQAAATPGAAPADRSGTAADDVDARYWALLRDAEALRDAGRLPEATALVQQARGLPPAEREGTLLWADLLARQGRAAEAEAAYRQLLDDPAARGRAVPRLLALLQQAGRIDTLLAEAQQLGAADAVDTGALRDAADARVAQGEPGVALRWLEAGVALLPASPWLRHDLARLYARLGQPALGQAVVDDGIALAPADAEMRQAGALFYAAIDRDAEALALIDTAPAAARNAPLQALAERLRQAQARREADAAADAARVLAEAQRRADAAEARRQPREEIALVPVARTAAAGRSSLRGLELPLVLTRPDSSGSDDRPAGERWLHVDAVRLDAGALPAAFDEASLFGQVQTTGAPLAADLPQRARGLSAGIGHTGEHRRWDIGVIGAGFAVPNLVGGWREAYTLAGSDASVELSRRVLGGGLLSYAGTQDPVSGRHWGGVTLNALTLRLGRDIAGWSSSASLRAGLLRGRNVADNSTLQLRLATDRDLLQTAQLRANAGLTLAVWHYRRNLGFHTFGHGGYYSPQRYTSLGLPLDLQGLPGGDWRAWSWRVRVSVARSWTFEDDAPYFPDDAALQAAAGNPVHAGGSGGGWSLGLRAELERRLAPHWSAGAALVADRSAYYTPTQLQFYLRRHGKAQTAPVELPRPVQPYAQF